MNESGKTGDSYPISAGNRVAVPGFSGSAIVVRSDAVVVVDKPHGWLTIPGRRKDDDPRPVLVRHLTERTGAKVWIVHRLDREVSGLVVFARTSEAHRLLCGWFERHDVVKRYEALTAGTPPEKAGEQTWEGWLIPGRKRVHEVREPGRGRWSRTVATYRGKVASGAAGLLRWDLCPETGRSHQLRCQASERGFPIAGDALYGSTVAYRPDAIALRAVALEFPDATDEELDRLGIPRTIEVPGLSSAVARSAYS